jgi:hypothetical protein
MSATSPVLLDPVQHEQPRYRALSSLAVASLALGALAPLTVFHRAFAVLPAAGALLALWSLRRIRQAPEELTGRNLALAGLWVSVALGLCSLAAGAFFERLGIPRGYIGITFPDLQPDLDDAAQLIPPKALALIGDDELTGMPRKVFLEGYMYPGRQTSGIKEFLLVPSMGHCSFCTSQLKSTEVIRVRLVGDLSTRYKTTSTGVGGKLEIDPRQALNPLGGEVYQIEADYIR